ncbi:hypothetical protein ONE63_005196 [Megalurothrips usitatus]|uniref:Uncharacterized protein n=1 Tax=Megalurothrips usitatus TaxID=439358 RepID=A0AAV7XUL5_9NEOP|nr:hypothetical protein ONE63_005196 [Megalurothrips usitatus]
MNGLCYSLSSDRLAKPDAPLVENEKQGQAVEDPAAPHKKKNVFYYAFGEAGFSAHVSEEAGEVLLGAPGVYSWRGSAVRYRINEAGRLVEMFVARPDTLQDYGYFGYSVTAGRFMPGNNRPGRVQYAAGAPRASDTGKVFLFDLADGVADSGDGMAVLQELSGEQLGEYFGAAVLAEDVTGDGLADLLVGAPQHTTAEAGDAGRVYVFLNLGDGQLQRSESPLSVASREGESQLPDDSPQSHGARFGYALASAGDSNEDGYNDVWVGAPYEDDGRGAVYLFLGSPSGLRAAAAQRVAARDVHRDLRSFGFSMSATADVDGNGYSDLAVGAPLAGHAVVLLARPTARLTPRLTASISELSLTATSFVLSVCLQYASRRAQVQAAAAVLLSLEGPSVQLERAALQAGGAAGRQLRYTQPLQLGRLACANVTVLIRPGGREGHAMPDYTTPIDITMRFNLSDEASRRGASAVTPPTGGHHCDGFRRAAALSL